MVPALRFLSLALILAAAPLPGLADTAAECRKQAAEDEVPAEDLEDYLAECQAVADSGDEGEAGQ